MKYIGYIIFVLCFSMLLCGCGNTAKVPAVSSDYVGAGYEEVMEELQDAGFTNIETVVIEDLSSSGAMKEGTIEEVVIDDRTDYEKGEAFSRDVRVIVTCHRIRKITAPISSKAVQNNDYEKIGELFANAGFSNVEVNEIFDADPDSMNTDYINEVSINGKTVFDTTEGFPFDAEVNVICHRPYEKYTVQVYVECVGNLIFSRYDIDFFIDEERVQQLEHGKKAEYEFSLRSGEHDFTFTEKDTADVKGTEKVDVFSDMEISYKLSCTSSKIDVETVYIDREIDLEDTEIKLEVSASDFKYKNYKEVVDTLEKAGFTNIKTDVLYDIVWGITSEGEVDEVAINGITEFKKGEVFARNAEIMVTYHMPIEDDPNRIIEERDAEGDREVLEEREEEQIGSQEQKLPGSGSEGQSEGNAVTNEILTADNNEELAELLSTSDDEITKEFAERYKGRQIEFDGYVADAMYHSNGTTVYKTRYDYLIYIGDSGQEHFIGPSVKFENISYNDFQFTGEKPDSVPVNMNLHIIAEVVEFRYEQGVLILKPISTSIR